MPPSPASALEMGLFAAKSRIAPSHTLPDMFDNSKGFDLFELSEGFSAVCYGKAMRRRKNACLAARALLPCRSRFSAAHCFSPRFSVKSLLRQTGVTNPSVQQERYKKRLSKGRGAACQTQRHRKIDIEWRSVQAAPSRRLCLDAQRCLSRAALAISLG